MNRSVKAWTALSDGGMIEWNLAVFSGGQYDIYRTRKLARAEYDHIVPCTITYDDGKPAKRGKKKGKVK